MQRDYRSSGDSPNATDQPDTAEEIIVECDGSVATIWFNRPTRRNAFDEPLMRKLAAALEDLARTWPLTTVIVFAGHGACFGAGGDLKMLARQKTGAEIHDLRASLTRIYDTVESGPHICIAAIHGYCVGSALVLAACCDFRLCAESARFMLPEINSGMLPGIGIARIGHSMSDRMLRRLMIVGDECSARDAQLDGFASEVVPDDVLMTSALDLARRIAAKPPAALMQAKRVANHIGAGAREIALDYERLANESLLESDEVRERLRSFVARRHRPSGA